MARGAPMVGSLFSGIGGLDLGLERAGFRIMWQAEVADFPRRTLRRLFPQATLYGDVRKIDQAGLVRVDLVCGGFPCQPISVAGKRRGVADERWLWPEFRRIVEALRPRLILIENVPGLKSTVTEAAEDGGGATLHQTTFSGAEHYPARNGSKP